MTHINDDHFKHLFLLLKDPFLNLTITFMVCSHTNMEHILGQWRFFLLRDSQCTQTFVVLSLTM